MTQPLEPPIFSAFSRSFQELWQRTGRRSRIGLAISGGVDSMALAYLCHRFSQANPGSSPSFIGYIVDHKLRQESTDEANAVAQSLSKLGIAAEVLPLHWKEGLPGANLETQARTQRYRALGQACYTSEITALLLAHHADDQAETVLSRLVGKYTGAGLRGMGAVVRIPECNGIAGGSPSAGGSLRDGSIGIRDAVMIHRPLLPFTKSQLIDVCRAGGVEWFEDPTNADKQLTMRNTIRYLQSKNVLPMALRREALCALAERVRLREEQMNGLMEKWFASIALQLDTRLGSLICRMDYSPHARDLLLDGPQMNHLKALLLRRILHLVSPVETISLQDLDPAVDYIFGQSDQHTINVAGVQIREVGDDQLPRVNDSDRIFQLHRCNPPGFQQRSATVQIPTGTLHHDPTTDLHWTQWRLFDNRFWVRVGSTSPSPSTETFMVRFFHDRDIATARKGTLGDRKAFQRLKHSLQRASVELRHGLPVICDDAGTMTVGPIVTLMTDAKQRSWTAKHDDNRTWTVELRYKGIEMQNSDTHQIIAIGSPDEPVSDERSKSRKTVKSKKKHGDATKQRLKTTARRKSAK